MISKPQDFVLSSVDSVKDLGVALNMYLGKTYLLL